MMASAGLFACLLLSLIPTSLSIQVFESKDLKGSGQHIHESVRSPGWIQNVSFVLPVSTVHKAEKRTAIVTFAGKKDMQYIDGAIMLGMSISKHLKGYPMVALIIKGMAKEHKYLLRAAGWHLTEVPNWEGEYCGDNCDLQFLGRWHDSFEKINTFRLPFERVLFLDSDTYIFSSRVEELLKQTELPDGHIAMAKDGCKDEFNSGVMLYRPDVNVFTRMLALVTQRKREQILDQNLVNEVYRGKIKELPREFNCVDTMGIQPGTDGKACKAHCSGSVVVAHFTGHPKPTASKRRLLELVRRPGSPALACKNTNFGSCAKWSDYYCDIRNNSRSLSKDIQHWLTKTGDCCHSPFRPGLDAESCKECPATLKVWDDHRQKGEPYQDWLQGTYVKTNMKSTKFNGRRPIYMKKNEQDESYTSYMYFVQAQLVWMIGLNPNTNLDVGAYAVFEAQCPRDAGGWSSWTGNGFERRHLAVKAAPNGDNAPNDTEHIVWHIKDQRWYAEKIPEGFWQSEHSDD